MKILFITDLYPIAPDEKAQVLTLHNFVAEWIKQGHQVDVIKPNFIINSFIRGKNFYKNGFYNFDGVNIFNVNYHSPFLFNIEKKLSAKIEIQSYDVLISHMPSGIIFAHKLAKKYNKPLICAVHNSDLEVLKNPVYKFYFASELKKAYHFAKKIACRSYVLEKKFVEIFPELQEKTFVAESGVKFQDENLRKNFDFSNPIKVLTCARLIKRKNIDKLISAINNLSDFSLEIIGTGREFKNLKKISNPSKVTFLGHLLQKKVLEKMRDSDIFILPSVNETFGMVYLEALASGCITVCTKNDAIDGIIKDSENGFLCNADVQDIQRVLLQIKSFAKLSDIRKEAFETIKRLSPETCAKNYLERIN